MATVGGSEQHEYQCHADSEYAGMAPLIPEGDPTNILSTMCADYPLKGIVHPHPHDVLCGRGGQSNSHPGNNQWRMLVSANKELYVTLPKKQKMLLSQSIVNAVRSQNPPGRFLQKDSGGNTLWYDVGDKRAQEKTSQALREGAPEIRTKIHTPNMTSPNPGQAIVVPTSTISVSSNGQTSNNQLNSSNEGRPPSVPASPSSTIASSAQALHEVISNQPPALSEVTSSSVASAGSSSTQQHANHSKLQQVHTSTNPVDDFTPSPYMHNQVQPSTGYGVPIPVRQSPYSQIYQQNYHTQKDYNSQQSRTINHQQAYMMPPSDYRAYQSIAPQSAVSATQYPSQQPFAESNPKTQQQHYHQNQYYEQYVTQNQQNPTSIMYKKSGEVDVYGVPRDIDEVYIPTLREPVASPSQQKECLKYSDLPRENVSNDKEYNNNGFDEIPIVPPPLQGHDFSFGSTLMMSEFEQARLMTGTSFGTAMSYGYTGNQYNDSRNNSEKHMSQPVDGGLQSIGQSFGSVMSTTTSYTFNEPVKFDGAGVSFGSMMSYADNIRGTSGTAGNDGALMPTSVDGGLEDIGTSLGSLTLDPEERRRIIESARQDMLNEQCDNPEMPPPSFHAKKSRGNLLECSDSEESDDESEVKGQQLIAQKSLKWERMQAALAVHTTTASGTASYDSNTYKDSNYNQTTFYGVPNSQTYNNQATTFSSYNMTPVMLNIPTTAFDRDFSQMSAISVNDDFDKDLKEHSTYNYSQSNDPTTMAMYNDYTQAHNNNTEALRQPTNYLPKDRQGISKQEESADFDPLPYEI